MHADIMIEKERLLELKSYQILDSLPEEEYDEITLLASQICDTPISLITLIDNHRQWFKSVIGLDLKETPREFSFCSHAIEESDVIFEVNDTLKDERFKNNPYVKGHTNIRYYAGQPLVTKNGQSLGTLCVLDNKPRKLTSKQKNSLKSLANIVMRLLEMREKNLVFDEEIDELESENNSLELKTAQKTTELKKLNKRLSNVNSLFESAQNAALIGVWEIDLSTNEVYWSDMTYLIHEIAIGSKINLEKAIDFYHLDHRKELRAAVESAINDGKPYDREFLLNTASGKEIWVNTIGLPVRQNRKTIKLRGLIQNIDAKKRFELERHSLYQVLEKKVAQRTKDLKASNEELEAFSYSVSHDLRAPLRRISGFASALENKCETILDLQSKKFLKRIQDSAVHMDSLIQSLLELSRITKYKIKEELIDVTELCEEVIDRMKIPDRYTLTIEPKLQAMGDKDLITIVMSNLIDNAVKYSSKVQKPLIQIGETNCHNRTTIFVKDNGAGFNMRYAKRLFSPFQRLHSKEEFDGTGIGLATVNRIIKKHGGRVWAESQPSAGTTFYVTLGNLETNI